MLRRTHPVVVFGLLALSLSGLLLLGADLTTYLQSRVFWLKMAFIAVLAVNGMRMLMVERRARDGTAETLARLQHSAAISLLLWAVITLAGSALPNIG